jgi:hypothetical protein
MNTKKSNSVREIASEIDKTAQKGAGVRLTFDKDGDPIIEAHKTHQIKNIDELMEAANYSREEWEVTKTEANVWHQMSNENGLVPLWQVKAKLQRKQLSPEIIGNLFQAGADAFRKALRIPSTKLAKKTDKTQKGVMVEFALPDLHLGKLAWNEETKGGNWNVEIAEQTWKDAILDLQARAPQAEEAWLVVGNDFYNVDNLDGSTTSGTPQDEDGRWQRTWRRGATLISWTIGVLRKKFPKVKVIVVYGNHDHQRSFYLGEYLQAWFHEDDSVDIDNNPCSRKYFQWGNTGIGFTHGDRVKTADLAHLCTTEARQLWGNTKRFELHLGHLHQNIVKPLGGVIIRWLPALCTPDAWHAKSGYTMSEKAAMLFEYDQTGLRNIHMHYPNEALFA